MELATSHRLLKNIKFDEESCSANTISPLTTTIDEDGSVTLTWYFGPQGHPASMRVYLELPNEQNVPIYLYTHGPLLTFEDDSHNEHHIKDIARNLTKLIDKGLSIDKQFGKDPFWWKCKTNPNCENGWLTKGERPFPRCSDCAKVAEDAKTTTKQFLKENY